MEATARISLQILYLREGQTFEDLKHAPCPDGFTHRLNPTWADESLGRIVYARWEGPKDGIVAVYMKVMDFVIRLPWDLWCVGYEQRGANDVVFYFQRRDAVPEKSIEKTPEWDVKYIGLSTLSDEERIDRESEPERSKERSPIERLKDRQISYTEYLLLTYPGTDMRHGTETAQADGGNTGITRRAGGQDDHDRSDPCGTPS
jgi:hypothetical protein